MSNTTSTRITLASRPQGWPTHENFATEQVACPDLEPGQVRVRNEFVSVDPYLRGRMDDVPSYIAPFQIGDVIASGAIGRVVESRADDVPVGAVVMHMHGWTDIVQDNAATFTVVDDIPGVPLSVRLHVLGLTGLTAYIGLTEIAHLSRGETVFVSGAAGAVGTATGQIARLLGAGRVIGSAGSAQKVALLTEKYGYDAAFNYKDGDVLDQVRKAAPDGVDVYFDNVGGDHLEAALAVMRRQGRIAMCGAISAYNTTEAPAGPRNLGNMIRQGLTMRGFTVGDHLDLRQEFQQRMTQWFGDGQIAYDETIVDGIEHAPDAFLDMMRGGNIGKMLVRV